MGPSLRASATCWTSTSRQVLVFPRARPPPSRDAVGPGRCIAHPSTLAKHSPCFGSQLLRENPNGPPPAVAGPALPPPTPNPRQRPRGPSPPPTLCRAARTAASLPTPAANLFNFGITSVIQLRNGLVDVAHSVLSQPRHHSGPTFTCYAKGCNRSFGTGAALASHRRHSHGQSAVAAAPLNAQAFLTGVDVGTKIMVANLVDQVFEQYKEPNRKKKRKATEYPGKGCGNNRGARRRKSYPAMFRLAVVKELETLMSLHPDSCTAPERVAAMFAVDVSNVYRWKKMKGSIIAQAGNDRRVSRCVEQAMRGRFPTEEATLFREFKCERVPPLPSFPLPYLGVPFPPSSSAAAAAVACCVACEGFGVKAVVNLTFSLPHR
jgi:hypothetical protein